MKDSLLSYRGAYLYVNYWLRPFNTMDASQVMDDKYSGLYISSLHGKTASSKRGCSVNKIDFLNKGENAKCSYCFDYHQLSIQHEGGNARIAFANDTTIMIQGEGEGFVLDNIPVNKFDYIQMTKSGDDEFYLVTNYRSKVRLLVYALKGSIKMDQNYYGDEYAHFMDNPISRLMIVSENNQYDVVVKEIPHNMIPLQKDIYDYDLCTSNTLKDFKDYCARFPKLADQWQEGIEDILYTLWGNEINARDTLQKRNIITSPYYNALWSYDYGYLMRVVYSADRELALNLATVFFDQQDELGCVPGTITDNEIRWCFLKPPAFGYFAVDIIDDLKLSKQEATYFYEHLEKQINFYLTYRDSNHDGICEYHHGNESGLDNMSVFDEQKPIDTVDMALLMINNYLVMSKLALILNNGQADYWNDKAQHLRVQAADYFIKDNMPISRYPLTGEIYESKSILPYFVLNLGDVLKKETVENIVQVLKDEFITPWGLASESLKSKEYSETSWFRGFTFYQPTNVIDGLAKCGYTELASELSAIFCQLVKDNGTRDGYSTKDGRPILYDSMSMIAATYYHLADKYLR